jgi:predicted MPP superfamily phosphohydrolase
MRVKRGPRQASNPAESPAVSAPAHERPEIPRRQFLTQAGVGGAICLGQSIAGYGTARGRVDYQLEEAPVRIAGLPRSLDGFCIAQLSDVHIGQFTGERELAVAREFLRRARPDLIVITGDLLDQQISLAPVLGRFVRSLEGLARHGVITISGNHDFYAGVDEVEATLANASIPMLRNQGLFIGDRSSAFALLGVDDVWGRRVGLGPDLKRALQTLETDGPHALGLDANSARARELAAEAPRILLCHNPTFFEESAGKVALQLSGHTHGGQIVPGGQVLGERWIAGPYSQAGSHLYVNRGFGTVGPPSRLGAPPEITRHILMA